MRDGGGLDAGASARVVGGKPARPAGRRSVGGGQYAKLWGDDYRQTINANMMVVIMIETPLGAANAKEIAAVPGVDVIFAAAFRIATHSFTSGDGSSGLASYSMLM